MGENENDLAKFPPEVSQAIDGLLWLGHLEREVSYGGHTFLLRTMKGAEELETSLIAKDYLNSLGQVKANAWATIAGALVAVDGSEDFCIPLGPDKRQHLRAKFDYISKNWYWPIAVKLFDEYTVLLEKQEKALEAAEDLSQRTLSNSSAFSGSSIKAASSNEDQADLI